MSRQIACLIGFASQLLVGCAGGASGANGAACPSCAPPPASNLTFAAEILPPANSKPDPRDPQPRGIARQELSWVFAGSWTIEESLANSLVLAGKVIDGRDPNNPVPVAAQVVATRPSLIAGLPPVTEQATTGPDGSFSLALQAGTYSLRVLPHGPAQTDYPPATLPVELRADMLALTVSLQPSAWLGGAVMDPIGRGVAGAKVRAIDADTSALLSSVVVTDASGAFSLALGSDATSRPTLRLVADSTDASGPPVRLFRDVDAKVVQAHSSVELRAPALPAQLQQVTIPVRGHATSGVLQQVAYAQVDLTADLSDAGAQTMASFSTSVGTDGQGRAVVLLIPGVVTNRKYTVVVTPLPDSMFASGTFTIDVGPVGGVLSQLVLDARSSVVGQIVGPDGTPLRGTLVEAQPASDLAGPSATQQLPQAATDSDGRFLLRLEAGRYDLSLVPAAGELLPRWSIDGVQVTGGTTDVGRIALPAAAAATIVLLDAAGKPAPGIEVRLYSTSGKSPCTMGADCPHPHLRADANSAADGVVPLLLGVP